jgi:hypothetical protein
MACPGVVVTAAVGCTLAVQVPALHVEVPYHVAEAHVVHTVAAVPVAANPIPHGLHVSWLARSWKEPGGQGVEKEFA